MTKSMAFVAGEVHHRGRRRGCRARRSRRSRRCRHCPGATISRSHLGFCITAQASACSRPPPPRIRMFMPPPCRRRPSRGCGPPGARRAPSVEPAADPGHQFPMDELFDDEPRGNAPEFTVSELSGAVKRMIEGEFGHVRVRGEVGRVTPPALGACLSRPEGRPRGAGGRHLEGHRRAADHPARGGDGGHRHRPADHLSRPVQVPDRDRGPSRRRASAR